MGESTRDDVFLFKRSPSQRKHSYRHLNLFYTDKTFSSEALARDVMQDFFHPKDANKDGLSGRLTSPEMG